LKPSAAFGMSATARSIRVSAPATSGKRHANQQRGARRRLETQNTKSVKSAPDLNHGGRSCHEEIWAGSSDHHPAAAMSGVSFHRLDAVTLGVSLNRRLELQEFSFRNLSAQPLAEARSFTPRPR
jgi:hypothetical protein